MSVHALRRRSTNNVGCSPFQPPKVMSVVAQCNDPSQRVTVRNYTVSILGTATDDGLVRSALNLAFDGKQVLVGLGRGMTPFSTQGAVSSALPEGYELRPAPSDHYDDSVTFQIVKTAC